MSVSNCPARCFINILRIRDENSGTTTRRVQPTQKFLVPALRELGFKIPKDPEGAFYVYCGLPDEVEDAEDFCARLLETEFVAITPGTDFGFHQAERKVRISFARNLDQLEEAVTRIARALR